jgi:hypothetical protein
MDTRQKPAGSVDSAVLALLYHLADLLVPLSTRTGSSVKMIEALAAGKALLGTSVALRGLELTPGLDSLLEDDFSRSPGLIRATLRDRAGLSAIGRAAPRGWWARPMITVSPSMPIFC